ncbi:MAG: hypothetical protein IK104_10490 [Clostridia bacterium]|nr:hypothetical protein [Clostridia bacterium]
MKHSVLKKTIAVLTAILLFAAAAVPAIAAGGKDAPVIVIPDMVEVRYYQNPNTPGDTTREIFSVQSDKMTTTLTTILMGLSSAATDTAKGSAQIASAIDDIFANIQCDSTGEPVNPKIGIINFNRPVAHNVEEYIYDENMQAFVTAAANNVSGEEIFYFNYDWRLDPKENGLALKTFIDNVKRDTGKSRVSIVARGYGGVVANAYAHYETEHAKQSLASFVLLDSLVMGSSLIGAVMSYRLVRTVQDTIDDLSSFLEIGEIYDNIKGEDIGAALARYIGEDPSGLFSGVFRNMLGTSNYSDLIAQLILKGTALIIQNEGLFTKIGSGYREILLSADEYIYSKGLREYMRNMPGLWAAVPEEYYDTAVSFMFGDEEIDPALKEKMDHGREVMYATELTLNALQTSGVNLNIVAGYNHQMIPITAQINEQSDGYQATRYAGIGAKTGDIDKSLSTQERCTNGNHNHMEPGRAVDASTCFFPENTWFIKNHKHNIYSAPSVAEFVAWLVFSDTQRSVWQHELYPQYLQESLVDGSLSPYSTYKAGDEQNFSYGDLDFDGVVSASDARLALRYAVGLDKVSSRIVEMIGNVDGKAGITAEDARLILRYAVGLEKKFPVEK